MLSDFLGKNTKANEVKTSSLKVRGKTLIFTNTVYSIPNLSVVAVGEIKQQYLQLGVPLLFLGFWLFVDVNETAGIIAALIGAVWIYQYYFERKHGLRLVTNSGESTVIISQDLEFLKQVAMVLYNLMNTETFQDLNINMDQRQIVEIGSVDGSQIVMGNVSGDLVNSIK